MSAMTSLKPSEKTGEPRVGSVVAAAAILRLLAGAVDPVGVSAVARATDLSPSSCFNILKTLVAEGFLDFNSRAKTYSLGVGLLALARRSLDPSGAMSLARPTLERFARNEDVASALWRLTGTGRLILVGFAENEAGTRIHLSVGQRLPMLIGAMGRCVAGAMAPSPGDLRAGYDALRWARAPGFATYVTEVEAARTQGWALDQDCFLQGVTTVASAVIDGAGHVGFCISNTMFTGRHDAGQLAAIGEITRQAAVDLSSRLFGSRF